MKPAPIESMPTTICSFLGGGGVVELVVSLPWTAGGALTEHPARSTTPSTAHSRRRGESVGMRNNLIGGVL
ncbi:Uncharacterised protein [Mycobacteroides abscessus subsp. abscessus]|nr:Uncharacterised protein [Mycobacteroides abscessus subsp. abscessus]